MAITLKGTATSNFADGASSASSPATHSHTVTADTDLLIVAIGLDQSEYDNIQVSYVEWNGYTLNPMSVSGAPQAAGDKYFAVYGLIDPPAGTANVSVALDVGNFANGYAIAAFNIAGVALGSLAGTFNEIDTVQDDTGAQSVTFSSGGSAGNALFGFWNVRGHDTDPLSADTAGFSLLYASDIGSTAGSVACNMVNIAYDLDISGASTCTISADTGMDGPDENAGVYLEFIADSGGSAPPKAVGTKTISRVCDSVTSMPEPSNTSHTVPSGTTLLVVDIITNGAESTADDDDLLVKWNTSESLTRIYTASRTSKTSSDPHIQTWALVNPTATSANVTVDFSDRGSHAYVNVVVHATNYSGTDTSSAANAISNVDEDVNLVDSDTCDIASGGTAGNTLHAVTAWKGTDTSRLYPTIAGWATLSQTTDASGASDWDTLACTKEAPSAITWDAAGSDPDENNMGVLHEIAPTQAPGPIVKSVERVTIDWDATSEPVTQNLSKSQTYTQCVPFFTKRLVSGSLTDDFRERTMKVEMIDNAGTPAVRVTASGKSSANDHRIEVYVVEFDSTITVQQVDADIADTNGSANITISDVGAQTKAFFLYSYQYTYGSAQDRPDYACVRPIWNGASTTSVTIERTGTTGTIDGMLYVVSCESNEFSVQHRDISIAATDELTNDTITGIPMGSTFLLTHFRSSEAEDDPLDWSFVADLSTTTNVRVRRSIAGASNAAANVGVQVVTALGGEWAVQRGDLVTTSSLSQATVISAVDRARSMVKTGTHEAGLNSLGTSDLAAGTIIDEVGPSAYLSSNNTITWIRESVSETGNTIPWEVIQFQAGLDNPILIPTGPLR